MARYSRVSDGRLDTADPKLQHVFREVIVYFDHSIIYGYRAPELQFDLFKRGRRLESGVWVIENRLEVVTFKDGYEKLSNHNYQPSRAIDAIPYPQDWEDTERMCYFAGVVMEKARQLGYADVFRWGGDWDRDTQISDERFVDRPHFEVLE